MQSLAQPLFELSLHTSSRHALESHYLLDSVVRSFGFHFLDVSLLFVGTAASIFDDAFDLQLVFYKFFQRIEISSTLIVLTL